MTRTGDALIEFQDGEPIQVLYWPGPGFRVQWVNHRVCNEDTVDGTHWVKCVMHYEHGEESDGNKFWVPRWRVRPYQQPHSEWRKEHANPGTHFPAGS